MSNEPFHFDLRYVRSVDDRQLVEAWRKGEREAGEELFAKYFDQIYRFFSHRTSEDVADLVQGTFLKCAEHRHSFRGASSVRTYMFAIARNELYQHYRSRSKERALDFSVSSLHDMGESPSTRLGRRGEEAILVQALERIPLELQLIVELHYWEGFTGPEVAHVLDIPEGTVRSRIRRALEKLREEVRKLSSDAASKWQDVDSFETWAKNIHPYDD